MDNSRNDERRFDNELGIEIVAEADFSSVDDIVGSIDIIIESSVSVQMIAERDIEPEDLVGEMEPSR